MIDTTAIPRAISQGERIKREVLELVGRPYRDPETGLPEDGFDCLELCAEVYRIAGLEFPLPSSYGRDRIPVEAFVDWAVHWEPCRPEPYAVVDMSPSHAGVLLPDLEHVIHSRSTAGVIVTRLARLLDGIVVGYWRRPRA